jgi:membrane protease YdiL (CAAX protease family)
MSEERVPTIFGHGGRIGWWRAWFLLCLPPVLLIVLSFGYGAYLVRGQGVDPATVQSAIGPAMPYILLANHGTLFLLLLWFVRLDGLLLADVGWRAPFGIARELTIGLVMGAVIFAVHEYVMSPLVSGLLADSGISNMRISSRSNPLGPDIAAALAIGVLGGGVVEEALYRGYVLTRLSERMPVWLALVPMLALFGALHFGLGLGGIAIATFTGLLLSLLFVWRESVVAPMVAHACVNVLVILL